MKIYIVGGAVRDELLGLKPKDIDYLVTGATPAEMEALGFEQVGADFPVFLHPVTKDEYALARIERKTGVGYHGFSVDFDPTVTVADDLSRRDLTMNAMAVDTETGELVDPFGGRHDLEAKVLRHVSPAFAEDPLRVVRLARLSARFFGFTIASKTMELARDMVARGELNHLPHERFWLEMEKVLCEEMSGHFFYVLDIMGAFEHVDFFRNLLEFDNVKLMGTALAMNRVRGSEEKLMFFTALRAKPGSTTILSAPSRTQRLYDNINRVRNTRERTAETVYTTLWATRAWSQSPTFDDLVRAMQVEEGRGESFFIPARELSEMWAATSAVKAADFPGLQGKVVGDAIANARREIVAASLDAKKF